MQVNVFIAKAADGAATTLLVLPHGPMAAIPRHLQGVEWSYFATTTADDKLIGATAETIEQGIGRDGYAVVSPTG